MPLSRFVSLAAFLLAVVATSSNAAAERVKVRAWPHDDFLRVVFDWKTPVEYTARIKDGVLTVDFDRQIETDLSQVEKNLADHIVSIGIDDAGHRVRARLDRDFELRHFLLNGSVVVDLVRTSGVQSAKPATVRLRLGAHDGFTRAVFDWPSKVPYSVERGDGTVSVHFASPAKIDMSAVDGRDPNILSAILEDADDGTTVRFTIQRGAEVDHFRDGPRVALDVKPADPPRAAEVSAAPVEEVRIEAVPGVPEEGEPTGQVGRPTPIAPTKQAVLAAEPDTELASGSAIGSGPILPLHFTPREAGGELRFVGGKSRPAAVFSRGGWTWMVIDQPGVANVARLRVEADRVLEQIEQLPDETATILRFKLPPKVHPVAIADGEDWVVNFAIRPSHPLVEIKSGVHGQANRNRVVFLLDAGASGRPLRMSDPEIGDQLVVVPIALAGHGVPSHQRLIDLDVLATAQGVALAPRREHIGVALAAGGLAVDAEFGGPLHLTPDVDRASLVGNAVDALPRMFDFEAWRRSSEPDFNAAKMALQQAIVRASEEARNEKRMDLARFYFARGFSDRSLGALAAVARGTPEVAASSPEFIALRGANRLLLGDLNGAAEDLNSPSLDVEPELGLWRAALLAESGDFLTAAVGLQQGHTYTNVYPDTLRVKFALLGADIGLKVEEPSAARAWLSSLEGLGLEGDEANLARIFEGQALLLEGNLEEATAVFDEIIAHGDRRSRAIALLARTELLLKHEDYTLEQAIEDLESLRFVWRGDSFEFSVLRRLGELQIENGSVQQGLQTLKRATSNFEEHPQVSEITQLMQSVFEELFLGGGADSLAPVKAIALFNEFRELTPPSAPGDRMIRLLADRLATVDLLEQAAGLLQHQVEFRIADAVEKAEVGARLAALRLLDRQPGAALEALDATNASALPDALEYERQVIRARAMAELGQVEDAIRLLEGNPTEEAARSRAGILWDIQDWGRAAAAIGNLVEVQDHLTESEARDVLRWAIALSLDGQSEALAETRRDFGVAMLSTPYAIDFRVITSNEGGPADIQSAVRRVAAVDDFRAFMEQYRGRAATTQQLDDTLVN